MSFGDFFRGIPGIGDIAGAAGLRTSAEKEHQKALEKVLTDLAAYRPEMIQTRQTALDNAMKLFAPVNRALVGAYGEGAALPIEQATQSPYSDEAMAKMRKAATVTKPRF